MICRAEFFERDRVVLVGHNPPVVFATKASHIERLQKKPDGHYEREDLMSLVEAGNAVLYDEEAVHDILDAVPFLVHGCGPW